jgi:hypothetical protein
MHWLLISLLTLGLFAGRVQTVQALCYTFTTIDIPTPNGNIGTTTLQDINHKGEIVGDFTDSNPPHGYLIDKHGAVTTIAFPGARSTALKRINKSGEITGWYTPSIIGGTHGFFRDRKGQFTTLDVPGSNLTEPTGINDLHYRTHF